MMVSSLGVEQLIQAVEETLAFYDLLEPKNVHIKPEREVYIFVAFSIKKIDD